MVLAADESCKLGDAHACWPWEPWPPPGELFARGAVADERPWESTWQPILGQLCEGFVVFLRCLHSPRWDRLRLEGQRRETGAASSTFCLSFPHPGAISVFFFSFLCQLLCCHLKGAEGSVGQGG